MASETRNDITVNGGGTIAAGSYEDVTINGSGTVTGDLVCTTLRINGAGTCAGTVKAATVAINGTATFESSVQVGDLAINGTANVRAGLGAGTLTVRGNLAVDGGVAVNNLELKGFLRTDGDITGTSIISEGAIEAQDIHAETVDLTVYGTSTVRNVDATRVTLRRPGGLGEFVGWFKENRLNAGTVRAREVWAENTTANVISAGNATIGRESRIGLVLYSGTCSVVDGAQVTESRKADAAE